MLLNHLKKEIESIISQHPIVVFMKGTPDFPQCGFSAKACHLLRSAGVKDIFSLDILERPDLREGIKQFTQWPTLPQIFIKGEFIGGSDILSDLFDSGELHKKLS